MNKVYLVINGAEDTFLLNICGNRKSAENCRKQYINNFINNAHYSKEYAESIILIEELQLSNKDIIWSSIEHDDDDESDCCS